MAKLSDSQLVILSQAARRADGAVLPAPRKLKVEPRPVLHRLLKAGLIAEAPATPETPVWREGRDGERLTLLLTDAGREAIGIETVPDAGRASPGRRKARGAAKKASKGTNAASTETPPQAPRETKQGLLIALLSRPEGASIAEAAKAIGWQPHSVRGAISGSLKKKLGFAIVSEVEDGRGRVYRIAAAD